MIHFGDKEVNAFNELKAALVSKSVLKLYKTDASTELHTDASKYDYGSILLQCGGDNLLHPVLRERPYDSHGGEV